MLGKLVFGNLTLIVSDYGVLEKLARQRVKPELIEQNWDDLLRIAGSLKLGTVSEA